MLLANRMQRASCPSALRARAAPGAARCVAPLTRCRRRVAVRASVEPPPPKTPEKKKNEMEDKVDKVIEELKKTGMTSARAKQVLRTWTDEGVKDPEQLRKLLMTKTMAPIPKIAVQGLLDAIASFGGFYLGGLASEGDIPFRIGLEILGYFFGLYYFVQMLLNIGSVSGLLFSTYKYGTSSESLLAAVQSIAGPASGIAVFDKANQVVNMFKVMSALETVASLLRDTYNNPPKDNSLRNLGAYLTLAQARESLGFTPEKYGLTDKEAGNIAYAFSTYDTNQNFTIDKGELGVLCSSLGKELEDKELEEAIKILDVNKNGNIDFVEFVSWWTSCGVEGCGTDGPKRSSAPSE